MVSASLLDSVRALSLQEKLALIQSITEMAQNDLPASNGSQPSKPVEDKAPVYTKGQQNMRDLVQELLSRPNPPPEKMLKRGAFKGRLPDLTEEDFKIAEWHPTEDELNGY